MNKTTLLFCGVLALFSSPTLADSWISKPDLKKLKDGTSQKVRSYKTKKRCEARTQAKCINVDTSRPRYKKRYRFVNCEDYGRCKFALNALSCNRGDIKGLEKNTVIPGYSGFCTRIVGFKKADDG